MAINNDLSAALQGLVAATGANSAPEVTAAATTEEQATNVMGKTTRPEKPGENYKWDKENQKWVALTPEEIAKKAETLRKKTEKDALYTNLIQHAAQNKLDPAKVALKKAYSQRARIAAYVTNTESKFEITNKKVNNEYNIGVVNRGPGPIKAVIITVPAVLTSLKQRFEDGDSSDALIQQIENVAATKEETAAVSVIVKPWEEFARFLQNDCAGYLHEDDSIFAEYTSKSGRSYRNPADIEQGTNMPAAGSFVYLKFTTSSTAARTYSIKHSIRAKILAPGNYIAMKRWQTEQLMSTYTEAEASERINAYLARFCVERTSKSNGTTVTLPRVIHNLTAESNKLFTIKNNTIASTAFFPVGADAANGAWIKSEAAKAVAHWYYKDAKGSAKAVAVSDIALPKKNRKVNSNSGKVTYPAVQDALKLAGASDGVYKFDAKTFPLIIKALRGHEDDTLSEIQKVLKSAKTSSKKTGTTTKYKSYANSGVDIMSLDLDTITAMLTK